VLRLNWDLLTFEPLGKRLALLSLIEEISFLLSIGFSNPSPKLDIFLLLFLSYLLELEKCDILGR